MVVSYEPHDMLPAVKFLYFGVYGERQVCINSRIVWQPLEFIQDSDLSHVVLIVQRQESRSALCTNVNGEGHICIDCLKYRLLHDGVLLPALATDVTQYSPDCKLPRVLLSAAFEDLR